MTKIFESQSKLQQRANRWKYSLGLSVPAALIAQQTLLQAQVLLVYPVLALPTLLFMYQSLRLNILFKNEVRLMWLMKNGNQLILETYDGVLHKVNIIENREHELIDAKDKSIVFVMRNSGREFYFSTKNAIKLDYNLMDRVIRAICVDTDRST